MTSDLLVLLGIFVQVSVDVVGLVDEWAARFFEELDYVNEGENGTYFAEMMKKDLPQVRFISLLMGTSVCCLYMRHPIINLYLPSTYVG